MQEDKQDSALAQVAASSIMGAQIEDELLELKEEKLEEPQPKSGGLLGTLKGLFSFSKKESESASMSKESFYKRER